MFFWKILISLLFALVQMHLATASPTSLSITSSSPTNNTLERRVIWVDRVDCHDEWYNNPAFRYKIAQTKYIREGIAYLKQVPGTPKLGPGPNKCERVSCSDWSAIAWCNEDPHNSKELPSYGTIAEAAELIVAWCKASKKEVNIKGQVFTQEKWSVKVEGDTC